MELELEEISVGYKDAYQAIQGEEERPLEELLNIESALALIKKDENSLIHYAALKKKRQEQIDNEVNKLKKRVEMMKGIVKMTLKVNNEKSIKFPGVGTASRKDKAVTWEIKDEEALLKVLKEKKEFDNCVNLKPVIDKKELNNLLAMWDKSDEVPDCIKKIDGQETLIIRFAKEMDMDSVPDIDLDFTK